MMENCVIRFARGTLLASLKAFKKALQSSTDILSATGLMEIGRIDNGKFNEREEG
jgi:hypothetical protein